MVLRTGRRNKYHIVTAERPLSHFESSMVFCGGVAGRTGTYMYDTHRQGFGFKHYAHTHRWDYYPRSGDLIGVCGYQANVDTHQVGSTL